MGVLMRLVLVILGLLVVGCTPFPGEEGGPLNYVSFISEGYMGAGRTTLSIDENDRVTYTEFRDSRRWDTPPKLTDNRRSTKVSGAYQDIVEALMAHDVQSIRRLCYTKNDSAYDETIRITDLPDVRVEWVVNGSTYHLGSSYSMCGGGSQPELNEIAREIAEIITNTVKGALGIEN